MAVLLTQRGTAEVASKPQRVPGTAGVQAVSESSVWAGRTPGRVVTSQHSARKGRQVVRARPLTSRLLRSYAHTCLPVALLRLFANCILTAKRKVIRMRAEECWSSPL